MANHKILSLVKLIGQPIGAVEEKTEEGVGRLLSKKGKEERGMSGRWKKDHHWKDFRHHGDDFTVILVSPLSFGHNFCDFEWSSNDWSDWTDTDCD